MDYNWQTTIWQDFTIADNFGKKAIQETYNKIKLEWGYNIVFMAELALTTNWKCWDFYEKENQDLAKLYENLYYETRDWVYSKDANFSDEDLDYYFEQTD